MGCSKGTLWERQVGIAGAASVVGGIMEGALVACRGCVCVYVRSHAGGMCVVGAGCGGRVGGRGKAGTTEEG